MNKTFSILAIVTAITLISCGTSSKIKEEVQNDVKKEVVKQEVKPVILNTDNFDQQISEGITVVDLWATWCAPCKAIMPIINDLAKKYNESDEITIAKLDVDSNKGIAEKYGVAAIPTILFFRNGALVDTLVGVASKGEIQSRIDAIQD